MNTTKRRTTKTQWIITLAALRWILRLSLITIGPWHVCINCKISSKRNYFQINIVHPVLDIKLQKYSNAISDCNEALERQPCNVKALLRKAQSLEAIDFYEDVSFSCIFSSVLYVLTASFLGTERRRKGDNDWTEQLLGAEYGEQHKAKMYT